VPKLPDEELRLIRYHTWHLTSDHYQVYYFSEHPTRHAILEEYEYFLERIKTNIKLGENQYGLGFDSDHGKISRDLVRYMMVMTDLVGHGVFATSGPQVLLEIGGGYGGLARLSLTLNPETAFVLLDLEETLFYQAVYLTDHFGPDRVVLCSLDDSPFPTPKPGHIYLVPQSEYSRLLHTNFDLAINQQSMQEMNREQIDHYCAMLLKQARRFYSCNLSQHNPTVLERTGVVNGLNAYLLQKFPAVDWDSDKETAWITRFVRANPKLDVITDEMIRMGSYVEAWARCYRSLFGVPMRRFSDSKIRRMILRTKE
jgi:putative sugar O-methyltransferase